MLPAPGEPSRQQPTATPRRTRSAFTWAVLAALAPLAVAGISCDRDSTRSPPHAQRTGSHRPSAKAKEGPAAQVASTKPAVPEAAPSPAGAVPEAVASFLYFQYPQGGSPFTEGDDAADTAANPYGVARSFRPARLRLTSRDGEVHALLCTDDQKDVLSKDWAGDRYYFSFPVQIDDLSKVDGAEWWYQSSPGEHEESPNGVYLKGDRYHLEATNAIIHFDGKPPHMTVKIAGQFLQYDTNEPTARPKPVVIRGVLMPKVEVKE